MTEMNKDFIPQSEDTTPISHTRDEYIQAAIKRISDLASAITDDIEEQKLVIANFSEYLKTSDLCEVISELKDMKEYPDEYKQGLLAIIPDLKAGKKPEACVTFGDVTAYDLYSEEDILEDEDAAKAYLCTDEQRSADQKAIQKEQIREKNIRNFIIDQAIKLVSAQKDLTVEDKQEIRNKINSEDNLYIPLCWLVEIKNAPENAFNIFTGVDGAHIGHQEVEVPRSRLEQKDFAEKYIRENFPANGKFEEISNAHRAIIQGDSEGKIIIPIEGEEDSDPTIKVTIK